VNGVPGTFIGTAEFVALADGMLRWHESGRLRLDHFDGPAYRTLTIVPTPDGHDVRFDDGRPFHHLDLSTGHTEVVHLCGPDRYHGTYACRGPGELHICWRVTGPDRDDEITSHYLRSPNSTFSNACAHDDRRPGFLNIAAPVASGPLPLVDPPTERSSPVCDVLAGQRAR
jgi:Family of unknown function (DUF6314)